MKKTTDYQKEFLEVFKKLAYCRSSWDVWNDFLDMGCISMSNSVPALYREDREKEYLSIIGRYKKEEQELFPELFGFFVLALSENPAQDFLGEMYHKLGLEQEQKGQFFTPYHICHFMSEIQYAGVDAEAELWEKGYLSVSDPACGAGAMLIAFANVSRKHGVNFQQKVLFVAQDIDVTATRMCYLQLAVLGCPAIVICGDSLAKPGFHPDNDVWYTPFYYLNEWRFVEKVPETEGSEEIADMISETDFQEKEDGQLCIRLDKTA